MSRLHVVAAVIRQQGRVLIAQRPAHKHQGGLWEFPGGKVEPGEPARQALARELEEELDIGVERCRPLIRLSHDYPEHAVCLDVWEVSAFRGLARGREGQPVRWVRPEELPQFAFPAANRPIVTAARLPALYFIAPPGLSVRAGRAWLQTRLQQGARLLLLRAPHLTPAAYVRLAADCLADCRTAGAQLLLHGDPAVLAQVPADGVHLPAASLARLGERPPATAGRWLAASVHDAVELARAQALGVDFVTLSPVQASASHPGVPGMGWARFAALAATAAVPVYALGGLGRADLEQAWQSGAQGVAGIRGL